VAEMASAWPSELAGGVTTQQLAVLWSFWAGQVQVSGAGWKGGNGGVG
jgi:hypothetical protein